jgi:hypothetical protein
VLTNVAQTGAACEKRVIEPASRTYDGTVHRFAEYQRGLACICSSALVGNSTADRNQLLSSRQSLQPLRWTTQLTNPWYTLSEVGRVWQLSPPAAIGRTLHFLVDLLAAEEPLNARICLYPFNIGILTPPVGGRYNMFLPSG